MGVVDVDKLSIRQLKALIEEAGLDHDDCFEKADLLKRAKEAQAAQSGAAPDTSCQTGTLDVMKAEIGQKQVTIEKLKAQEEEIKKDKNKSPEEIVQARSSIFKEIHLLQDAIATIEEAVILQSDVGDLQEMLPPLRETLEALEKDDEDVEGEFEKAAKKREQRLLESKISQIEEAVMCQTQAADLQDRLEAEKANLARIEQEEAAAKNAFERKEKSNERRRLTRAVSRLENSVEQAQQNTVRATFETWDKDGSGSISVPELTRVFLDLGLSKDIVDKMFAAMDANKDGEIDVEEFIRWTFKQKS